jgi:5-oxoprolinase (ATP-hydrolysing) subunit A
MHIDLNADLGEGCASDEAILEHVSSINIACGWHAGSAEEMQNLVRAALRRGIAIGAHPGYADREHFGRREMQLPQDVLRAGILYQMGALDGIVRAEGGELAHIKLHGALYNQAARDPALAQCVVRAIADFNPRLKVMALAGSPMIAALRAAGLTALEEGFADRRYAADGQLVARGTPGALIEESEEMLAQALSLVKSGTVVAQDGSSCRMHVDTICLHGDGPHALEFARELRSGLQREGITVAPCAGGTHS